MTRIFIGSVLGGIVQWIVGAIFWATPLARIAFRRLGEAETADLHTSLARTLTATGTGTYMIPDSATRAGAELTARGPVALVFFNSGGFAPINWTMLATGLVMSIVMLLLVGVALSLVDGAAARLKLLGLFAVATTLYFILAMPVYNDFMPRTWWVYLAVSDLLGFVAGGFVLVRWFMPRRAVSPSPTLH